MSSEGLQPQVGPGAPLGAVLAGGRGSRLGGAKATATLAGRPLLSYPLEALAGAGIEAVVVAKPETELPDLDCGVLREPAEPRHPLCGVVAALRGGRGRPLVVLACDMPFVSAAMLRQLASASEPLVLPRRAGRVEPFPARIDPLLLPALERSLAVAAPLCPALEALDPRYVEDAMLSGFGDPERLLFNVNDDEGLRRAARLLGNGG